MFKNAKTFLSSALGYLMPLRADFTLVSSMDEKTIHELPKAPPIESLNWIHPLFSYRDNKVRAIIWELKYKENTKPLETIGKMIFEEMVALMSDIILFDGNAKFILMPIPISYERRAERGYNQSEYLAKAIWENDISHFLLYAPQWLSKIKDTPRQSRTESKSERMKNLIGCFEADKRVEDKYVILIDDVSTTGATLSEARKTLLETGAKNVYAFTVAH